MVTAVAAPPPLFQPNASSIRQKRHIFVGSREEQQWCPGLAYSSARL
jgi:hypothetical protein